MDDIQLTPDTLTPSGPTIPALLDPPTPPAQTFSNTWTCTICVATINIFHRDSHLLTRSHIRKSCPTLTPTTPPAETDQWHCAPCDKKMHILHQETHLLTKRHAQNLVRPVLVTELAGMFLCGTCRAEVPAGELMGHLTTAEMWACGVCEDVVHLAWMEQHCVWCVQETDGRAGEGGLVDVEELAGRLDTSPRAAPALHTSDTFEHGSGEQYLCPFCAKMVPRDHTSVMVKCPLCGVRTEKLYEKSHHATTRHRKAMELKAMEEQEARQAREEQEEQERTAREEEKRKEHEELKQKESELKEKKEREEKQRERELFVRKRGEQKEKLRVKREQQEQENEQIRKMELLRAQEESRRQEEVAQQARRKLEEAAEKAKIERLAESEKRERYLVSLKMEETRRLEQAREQEKFREQQMRQPAAELKQHEIGEASTAEIPKVWTCTVCDRTMATVSKNEHLAGGNHQKKEHRKQVREERSCGLDRQKQDEEERHRILERLKREERSKLVAKTLGIHGKHTWDCEVCERTMSVMAKESHLAGKKHHNMELLQEQKERSLIESEIGAGNLGVNLR